PGPRVSHEPVSRYRAAAPEGRAKANEPRPQSSRGGYPWAFLQSLFLTRNPPGWQRRPARKGPNPWTSPGKSPKLGDYEIGGNPGILSEVLRGAGPHAGQKLQPDPGRGPHAALHQLRNGPVQGL